MNALDDKTRTLERLSRLAQSDLVPEKAKAQCLGIRERLVAPILMGIFGPVSADKRLVLNDLLGAEVVPLESPAVTLEVVAGEAPHSTLRLADGSFDEIQSYPTPSFLAQPATFASIASPSCRLLDWEFLLFDQNDSAQQMREDLEWAAPRVDLAIWCTRKWTELENVVWAAAPERIRDHSILHVHGLTGDGEVSAEGFAATVFEGGSPQTSGGPSLDLKGQIKATIAEAREHDLLSAELFLSRYDEALNDRAAARRKNTAVSKPKVAQQGGASGELGALFHHVKTSMEKLVALCEGSVERVEDVVDDVETALKSTAELLPQLPLVAETWPDLHESVLEARDLAVLVKSEGGADQAVQSARLLVQLRDEVEAVYLDHVAEASKTEVSAL